MEQLQDQKTLIYKQVSVWRDGQVSSQQAAVTVEEPLVVLVDGHQVAVLMRLPGDEKELAAGFLVSEGIVSGFDAILTIYHCGESFLSSTTLSSQPSVEWRNRVEVKVVPGSLRPDAQLDVLRLVRAGCGAAQVRTTTLQYAPVSSTCTFEAQRLLAAAHHLREEQPIHLQAGGVHAAGLYSVQGERIALFEDVGRHNAVDKACGFCLLRDIPLRDKVLLCSGRLSYEMVSKVIHLGIPVVASISAPTALALELAEIGNVTVAGYLRGSRMTVYTHPERIVFPDG
ncbi:MAG: formate dehydrogenase accessory sulfurtransferase FdhD [Anaerolineae bacterium]